MGRRQDNKNVSCQTDFHGACKNTHKLGTGFVINESAIRIVKEFRDISPRTSTLILKTDNMVMVLINAHALTGEKDKEEISFYVALEDVFDQTKGNIKLVQGDLNAKLEQEEQYKTIEGKHSLPENTSDNSIKLISFLAGMGLGVKITMFPRKDIFKYTWTFPNRRHKNQIDHGLINSRFKNLIQNIRNLREADINSNHLLIVIWMKVKIKKNKKFNLKSTGRTDKNKLLDKQVVEEYKECF